MFMICTRAARDNVRLDSRALRRRVLLIAACLAVASQTIADEHEVSGGDVGLLQVMVDDLRARLSISSNVVAAVVPRDTLMMSVEAKGDGTNTFRLSIDAEFLTALTDVELEAALAHELGHVWVFTHHPYLQTEQLANQIAMRAVSREALERVYDKVWKRGGTKGDLVRFLGPPAASAPVTGN